MPIWLYDLSSLRAALLLVAVIELISLLGLFAARRYLLPRFHFGDGINDAISGTVQAIGVFYGITVGLIAVAVWNTNASAAALVSKEASAIGALYRDVSGYPSSVREELRGKVRGYTVYVIDEVWPAQKRGETPKRGTVIMDSIQETLYSFEPKTQGQMALHQETLRSYNQFMDCRRLRVDAVNSGLSNTMWAVIWLGAAISIGVAYLYRIEDAWLHATLVILMSGFLALVLFMITINDKPFYGYASLSPAPYQLILDNVIDMTR